MRVGVQKINSLARGRRVAKERAASKSRSPKGRSPHDKETREHDVGHGLILDFRPVQCRSTMILNCIERLRGKEAGFDPERFL